MLASSMVLRDFGTAITTSEEGSASGAGSTMSVGDESTWIGERRGGGGVGIDPGNRRVVVMLPPSLGLFFLARGVKAPTSAAGWMPPAAVSMLGRPLPYRRALSHKTFTRLLA